jgi:formylglycine-generating enzyme required for sulfatase activity
MKMKKVLLFLLLAFFLTGNGLTAFGATINPGDYWVLEDGYSALFSTEKTLTVTEKLSSGENLFSVNFMGTGTWTQRYDASGNLLMYGSTMSGGGYFDVVNPQKAVLFPSEMVVGETHRVSWQRNEYGGGAYQGSDSVAVTLSGPETVTVPAGTYTTYKFAVVDVWSDSWGQSGTSKSTFWLAEGIGWVKVIRNGVTYEMQEQKEGPPATPTLTLSISGTAVTASWTASAGATSYRLFYAPYPNPVYTRVLDCGGNTGFSVNLFKGAAFYVYVQAYNSYGNSDYSNMDYFAISDTLSLSPSSLSLSVGQTGSSTISGGTSPYRAESGNTAVATIALSGSTLYVVGVSAGSATITVYDSAGDLGTVSVLVSSTYTNNLGMTFILMSAGTFTMGSPSGEPGRLSDETQHQVTLTQPFYMQQTEVTQAQWEAVMWSNPSYFEGCPTCPVEQVSWDDVQVFIGYLNAQGIGTYSLPTEAQWEYAARADSTTAFYNGGITEIGSGYDPNLNAIGWYTYNSDSKTHPVGQKTPNAWGLYDMSGNVYEWCQDWFSSSYYDSGAMTDPTGPSSGVYRVLRGGAWNDGAKRSRSADRGYGSPDSGRYYNFGFRLMWQPFSFSVSPSSLSLSVGQTGSCTISGGTGPYSATSSNTSVPQPLLAVVRFQ